MKRQGASPNHNGRSAKFTGIFCLALCAARFALCASVPQATRSPVASEDVFLLDMLWSRYRGLIPKDDIKIGLALGGGG